jgi:chromosome segregation ATPase
LTGLLNSIGQPTLDSLEDWIFLHGAGKLVPSSFSTAITDETQTQLIFTPAEREQRHQQRKSDLASARDELVRTKAELEYVRTLHKREKEGKEQLSKSLDRLLDLTEGLSQPGGEAEQEQWGRESMQRCYDEQIERLDAVEVDLRDQLEGADEQLAEVRSEMERLHAKCDQEGVARRDAEAREAEANGRLAALEKELKMLKETTGGQGPARTEVGVIVPSSHP